MNKVPSTFCEALSIAYQYVDSQPKRKLTPQEEVHSGDYLVHNNKRYVFLELDKDDPEGENYVSPYGDSK